MKTEPFSATYIVQLTSEQESNISRLRSLKGSLMNRLNYNKHHCYDTSFQSDAVLGGTGVVFTLDHEWDTSTTHDQILEVIANYFSKDT